MAEYAALYRLLSWLSPGYPVGAYTYSHGLEQAVAFDFVTDAETAGDWIADIVTLGAGFSDAVFLAEAHRAAAKNDDKRLASVAELAGAFTATKELALETHAQGAAFLEITTRAWQTPALDRLRVAWPGPYAYPVAVGCAAAGHRIAEDISALGYLHAFAANLVSATLRLVPLGQTDGQRIMAGLELALAETAERALGADVDEAATATLMADICSMRHETLHTRLFRS